MQEEDIRRVVQETVHHTLSGLGFTTSEPHELQADLLHIRRLRTGSEYISRKIRVSVLWGVVVTVASSFLFLLRQWILDK